MRATSLSSPAEPSPGPRPQRWPAPHYRALAEQTPHIVARFDARGRLAFLNPAAEAALGAHPGWASRPCAELRTHHPVFEVWEPGVREALERGVESGGEASTAAEHARILRYRIVPERGTAGNAVGALVFAEDVTAEARTQARLNHRAEHDALSGVLNRGAFLRHLDEAAAPRADEEGNAAFVLLFVDLDEFKSVNDQRGHAFGDDVLRIVGERLLSGVRPDDVVGRLGGDEFAVLLRGVGSVQNGVGAVQRIQRRLAEPMDVQGTPLRVTASIGMALATEAADPRALLADADRAMYHAKELGPGQYQVLDAAAAAFRAGLDRLDAAVETALACGELVLHFQPIVSLHDERMVGMEALVRWMHPERGLLGPQAFLPAAERSGKIGEIDRWVIRAAARQAAQWIRDFGAHATVPVSVNLSATHPLWADLATYFSEVLDEYRLGADALALEITETALLELSPSTLATLRQLREAGIRVSLDDFGTGYSSLSHLRHLSVDSLKIDRSFVHRIPHDPTDRAIVAGVVALAHTLGLCVVAEGIETTEQCETLREIGCDLGQGYYFGRPAAAAAMGPLLERNRIPAQPSA